MVKFFCFGNPLVKKDRMPLSLMSDLRKAFPRIEFVEAGSPEDIEPENEINIIDSVEGINEVRLIGMDELKMERYSSLHDFDLAMSLKLMEKMGKLKRVRIIGIPIGFTKKNALAGVKKEISRLLSS